MQSSNQMSFFGRQQWQLSCISLCNWGSFDGVTTIPILSGVGDGHPEVAVLSGKGGSGKSTVLDAMTVLLDPPRQRRTLNKASNRESADPRTLRDYVRGKGDLHDEGYAYLRHGAILSMICASYVSPDGVTYSLARVFFMPASDTSTELNTFYLTSYAAIDPTYLNGCITGNLQKDDLRKAFPEVTVHDGPTAFMSAVCDVLGIPHEYGNSRALLLLHAIQSGESVGKVDALYKRLVLDEPTTFMRAEEALEQFSAHWRTYDKLRLNEALLKTLSGMREDYADYLAESRAQDTAASLLTGIPAPFELWCAQKSESIVSDLGIAARDKLDAAKDSLQEAQRFANDAERAYEDARRQADDAGANDIDRIDDEIKAAEEAVQRVKRSRKVLAKDCSSIGADTPKAANELASLKERSANEMATLQAESEERALRLKQVRGSIHDSNGRMDELEKDIDYYKNCKSKVPRELQEARDTLAARAGLDPEDLPFLAEIIGVGKDYQNWELAINLALKPVSTIVLVSSDVVDEVRLRNNEHPPSRRLHLESVDVTDLTAPEARDEAWVSSRVEYDAASLFAPWVRRRITGTNVDFECVEDIHLLNVDGHPRITITGQTRRGTRTDIGHGSKQRECIIGFSNEGLVSDLEAELENEVQLRRGYVKERREIERVDALMAALSTFLETYSSIPFDDYDEIGAERSRAALISARERLLRGDLGRILELRDEKKAALAAAQESVGVARNDVQTTELLLQQLDVAREAARHSAEDAFARGARLTVSQTSFADDVYDAFAADRPKPDTVDAIQNELDAFRNKVRGLRKRHSDRAEELRRNIESRFATHRAEAGPYALANVSDTIESYPDYERHLSELEISVKVDNASRLAQEMVEGCSGALAAIQEAYREELETVRARIEPINQILGKLEFGDRGGRLKIELKQLKPSDIDDFRRSLNQFTSRAADSVDGVDDALIADLQDIMERIEAALKSRRGSVLDPWRLVQIRMRATWPAESEIDDALYEMLGSGSGSESRELVSFIYGSALLYYLGGGNHGVPSYRTVMLDEAFTESDPEYTARCVKALNGFGFQLVLAVPIEKLSSVSAASDFGVMVIKEGKRSGVSEKAWREYVA